MERNDSPTAVHRTPGFCAAPHWVLSWARLPTPGRKELALIRRLLACVSPFLAIISVHLPKVLKTGRSHSHFTKVEAKPQERDAAQSPRTDQKEEPASPVGLGFL